MKKQPTFWLYSILFCLLGGILGVQTALDREEWTEVMIEVTTDISDEAQLFFDAGRGFNAEDLRRSRIFEPNVRQTLQFRLPHVSINALRFDPIQQAGSGTIHRVTVFVPRQESIEYDLGNTIAAHEIARSEMTSDGLEFVTVPSAIDPQFVFGDLQLEQSSRYLLREVGLFGLVGIFIAASLAALIKLSIVYFR